MPIRHLWDRISTRLRPDRATLSPIVDFDPQTGALMIKIRAATQAGMVEVSRDILNAAQGKIGVRRFIVSKSQLDSLNELAREFHWAGDFLIASDENVPAKLARLQNLKVEKTAVANAITIAPAPVDIAVSADRPDSLMLLPSWTDQRGTKHKLALGSLRNGRTIRDGCTFYQVRPVPKALDGIDDDGVFRHHGDLASVKSFAEKSLANLKTVGEVELSDSAARLLQSAIHPRPLRITPIADFQDGELTVSFQSNTANPDGSAIPPQALESPWLSDGSFVKLDDPQASIIHRLKAHGPTARDGKLIFRGGAVPPALQILREDPQTRQSALATALQVHPEPLEQRSYIDLDDAGEMIIENNLQTSDNRTIVQPATSTDDPPDWLRVRNEYFRLPKRLARSPKAGRTLSNGKVKLNDDAIADFLTQDLPELRHDSKVRITPKAAQLRAVTAQPEVRTQLNLEDGDKVVIRPSYRSGDANIPHAELKRGGRDKKYFRRGNTFHRADWNTVRNVEKAVQSAHLTERADGSFVGAALNLQEIINTFSQLGILDQTEVVRRYFARLMDFSKIEEVPLPAALKHGTAVRDYQQHGYDWLVFLKQHGLPGILADEMGLGKTLQVLLAVAHFKDRYGRCPSLVVCPASLVPKWVDEARKFFADLNAVSYTGTDRKQVLPYAVQHADLLITTYETLLRDTDLLAQTKWRFIIADEAQKIKNPEALKARAIKKIPAEARIAVTGTPVENRLIDLWSIFDFLAPGYLYKAGEFRRQFAEPIEKQASREVAEELHRRIRPFVLRRRKDQVPDQLPKKIYKPISCELTELQRELYQAVVKRDVPRAIKAVEGKTISLGNPAIFAILTKLKQICSHPGLVTGDFKPFQTDISGKFDTFRELAKGECKATNGDRPNKIVGISQYVGMAEYLRNFVVSLKERCGIIQGAIPPGSRHALCQDFNADPNYFAMMLTLGAGGVGLDLQSANYVFIYDRWWNPAVEDQAIDRVHRLGQNRPVTVFTFTTRGTIEEKIERKLSSKRELADWVVRPDQLMRKEVTREELEELLQLDE